jgi:hypothetical protein
VRSETAKDITNIFGWLVLAASFVHLPILLAGATLQSMGAGSGLLIFSWALFALSTGTGIALIQKARIGFHLLYLATLLSLIGPRISFLPLIHRILPAGPEQEYYSMAINVAVALVLAWCHWSIARESDPRFRKTDQVIVGAFLIALIPGLIYWKTGVRTGNSEAPKIAQVPFIGSLLSPLESTQPVLYRSIELPRRRSGTVVFRGVTSTENVKEFARTHDLKLMTNAAARVKFIPQIKSWKLDPDRFPLLNGPEDLCYIGRLPKGSKLVVQLCHRPADGRFTGLAMGTK